MSLKITCKSSIDQNENLWGIVLAGGDGNRLRNFVQKIYGYYRPKQFCKIIGTRSLLQHTIDRTKIVMPDERIFVVLTKHHINFIKEEIQDHPKECLIIQPSPKDTGAGIIFPLIKVFKRDNDSTVIILPSDHFIEEEIKFMNYVNEASYFIEKNKDQILLVGIKPKQLESGCGWILKGSRIFHESLKINEVNEFVEKPDLQTTRELFNKDSLLNTFIMIGKSRTFLNYLRKYTPKLFNSFLPLLINKIPERERFLVGRIFLTVPMINFSYDFLTKICKHLSVVELSDIYWSDWGDENRIINDLKRIYNNKEYEIPLSVEEVIIFN
ncbi:MAG: hypothetical protein CMF23_03745 [Ignavibacteriae bacterium]|nr:hypothetical protein [Ignavibacteriota bacterium]|tara:strand:- start:213 stop:1190 length:978 start_codon:yes stop_codon:yes gene_type:complete